MDSMMTRRGFLAAGAAARHWPQSAPRRVVLPRKLVGRVQMPRSRTPKRRCALAVRIKCGIEAWVRGGKLWRFMGAEGHPAFWRLCGRGQGLPSLTTSEDRVTEPMKADGKGGFAAR